MIIALNEVYYGKPKKLLEAEKILDDIKKDYNGEYYNASSIQKDNRWNRLSELIGDEFGFKTLYIEVIATKDHNAYTRPICYAIDCMPQCRAKKNLIVDKSGMKFKPSAGYVAMIGIYTGLLLNPDYNAGEIMAMIIHEIGHNFQAVIDETMFWFSDITYIAKIVGSVAQSITKGDISGAIANGMTPITNSMLYRKIQVGVSQYLYKQSWYNVFLVINDQILGRFNDLKSNIGYAVSALMGWGAWIFPGIMYSLVLNSIISAVLDPLGYRAEKISDNFSTIYGYGPELSSALLKLETKGYYDKDIQKALDGNIMGAILRNGYGSLMMFGTICDPHPDTFERCYDQIRYLETEIKESDLSPACKAELNKQIDMIRKDMDKTMKHTDFSKEWDAFRYSVAQSVYTDEGDFRHKFMGKNIHKNIQKTYDKAIKNLK